MSIRNEHGRPAALQSECDVKIVGVGWCFAAASWTRPLGFKRRGLGRSSSGTLTPRTAAYHGLTCGVRGGRVGEVAGWLEASIADRLNHLRLSVHTS